MTSAQLVDLKGKKVGEVNLDDSVFGAEPNTGIMHSALVRQLANARAGTASTKTRSEVSGGGRKPWRQKGTGRARAGSIRSPLWAGGGVTFGPKPRDYSISLNKKQRRLALKSALAARKDELVVVKDFTGIKEAKTREMAAVLKTLGLSGKKVLLLLDYGTDHDCVVELAARNIAGLTVLNVSNLNVKDLLECQVVLTTESTINTLNQRFTHNGQGATAPAAKEEKPRNARAAAGAAAGDTAAEAGSGEPAKKASAKKNAEPAAETGEAAPKAPRKKKTDAGGSGSEQGE